jgi:hypothetical protein
MNGVDGDSIAYYFEELDNEPAPVKSPMFRLGGKDVDVSTLSRDQIFYHLLTIDETQELMNLEHVRTMLQVTTPNEPIRYPEGFIASPTFIHDDLHFLHIIQYQY